MLTDLLSIPMYFVLALVVPFWVSVNCVALACLYTPPSKRMKVHLVAVFLAGCLLNASLSFWSEQGLHVVSAGSVAITIWCLRHRQSIFWVYPFTFGTILFADLWVARHHPDYPAGIGGAGALDALFLAPLIFTGIAWWLQKKHFPIASPEQLMQSSDSKQTIDQSA